MALPDKHIRKAIHAAVHNMTVNGVKFPCYTEQTGIAGSVKRFTLISTQLNQPTYTKCGKGWRNTTQVQVIVIAAVNQGSKVLIDDASEALIDALEVLQVSHSSGMRINKRDVAVLNEFSDESGTGIVYRKVIQLTAELT